MAVSGMEGGRPAAEFYPLGHPTPYAYIIYDRDGHEKFVTTTE
jgi:hypothetical protein